MHLQLMDNKADILMLICFGPFSLNWFRTQLEKRMLYSGFPLRLRSPRVPFALIIRHTLEFMAPEGGEQMGPHTP